jgi:hypothetical protein
MADEFTQTRLVVRSNAFLRVAVCAAHAATLSHVRKTGPPPPELARSPGLRLGSVQPGRPYQRQSRASVAALIAADPDDFRGDNCHVRGKPRSSIEIAEAPVD